MQLCEVEQYVSEAILNDLDASGADLVDGVGSETEQGELAEVFKDTAHSLSRLTSGVAECVDNATDKANQTKTSSDLRVLETRDQEGLQRSIVSA